MRRSYWISLGVLSLLIFLPQSTHAAVSTIFQQIVPTTGSCNCLTAPDWGCFLQLIQNIFNSIVTLATVVITLFIALAGFTYMTSGGNPEKRSLANKRILNAVIGLAIVLCAWLFVNSLLKVLYNPSTATSFGPWTSILVSNGNDHCIIERNPPSLGTALGTAVGANNPGGGTLPAGTTAAGTPAAGTGKKGSAQCAASNSACSVQALQNAGLSTAQAQAMSCIAMSESSGNANTPNSSTGACGTFQITTQPGNWHNAAFHSGSCSVNTSCNDAACNLQTATIMLSKQGYQPWTGVNPTTGRPWNSTAIQCVSNFDPGH